MTDEVPEETTGVPEEIESPVLTKPEPEPEPTFVPLPVTNPQPVLDDQSKKIRVVFWYPQSSQPEISIDDGPFIVLPNQSNKHTIEVKVKGDDIFPFTCVFRNEYRTFHKQVFDYYRGIDASQVSIQRSK